MHAIPLEGSYNARGLGARQEPWLVRSAAPDTLTPGDEDALRAAGVDLIIDLREPSEQGPRTHRLPVLSRPLYGATPPAAGSLEAVYAGLIQDRGAALTAAVVAVAEHPGTALVHCTAGKDRTGLVVALARLAAGDDRADIVADYALSGATVRPARAGLVATQLDALALDPTARAAAERLHLDSPAEALEAALDLVEQLGGAREYLATHGATAAQLDALAARQAPAAVAS